MENSDMSVTRDSAVLPSFARIFPGIFRTNFIVDLWTGNNARNRKEQTVPQQLVVYFRNI